MNEHDLDVARAARVAKTGADVLGVAVLFDDAGEAFPLRGAGIGQRRRVEQADNLAGVQEVPCAQEVSSTFGEWGVHHDRVVVAHAIVREPVRPHDRESLLLEDRAQVGRCLDAVDLEAALPESVLRLFSDRFGDVAAPRRRFEDVVCAVVEAP